MNCITGAGENSYRLDIVHVESGQEFVRPVEVKARCDSEAVKKGRICYDKSPSSKEDAKLFAVSQTGDRLLTEFKKQVEPV